MVQIDKALKVARETKGIPTMILARTKIGHGVSFWDDNPISHGSWGPTNEQYKDAKIELEKIRTDIIKTQFNNESEINIIQQLVEINSEKLNLVSLKVEKTKF